jgi:hypothetical protein
MHRIHGGRGKVVWLPTFESDNRTLVELDAGPLPTTPWLQVTIRHMLGSRAGPSPWGALTPAKEVRHESEGSHAQGRRVGRS